MLPADRSQGFGDEPNLYEYIFASESSSVLAGFRQDDEALRT
jgi:hypothetical protein